MDRIYDADTKVRKGIRFWLRAGAAFDFDFIKWSCEWLVGASWYIPLCKLYAISEMQLDNSRLRVRWFRSKERLRGRPVRAPSNNAVEIRTAQVGYLHRSFMRLYKTLKPISVGCPKYRYSTVTATHSQLQYSTVLHNAKVGFYTRLSWSSA